MDMIPLSVPNLKGNEKKYLNECIDTTFVSSVGEFVTRLEQMCCQVTGAKEAVATSSGTTGLLMALISCGVEKEELVIIPSFTFIATANAVVHCGASPWCMEITKKDWTLDPVVLEKELREKTMKKDGQVFHKESGKRVAAIMPVYTLGKTADMEAITKIANAYHLPVIADGAAAIGATHNNKMLGELADATVFSFNGNKTITCGGGGMIVTNNPEIGNMARHISTTARVGRDYDHDMVGYNHRMTNIQAAVGCAQMERLDEFLRSKRGIRKKYREELNQISEIELFPSMEIEEQTCWFSGFVIKEISTITVREVCDFLRERGIEARGFWKPVHLQIPYQNCLRSQMDISESLWGRVVTLPCSSGIQEDDMEKVCKVVQELFHKR